MKKVFIGVLAALMLFAFTACEQSMPSYKQVEYVTLDQTQAFIENQPLSAEAFSVTVHYLDGSLDVFPGTGRVTFVNSTAEGATVVPDATAKAGVYAKATVAGESDIIGIKTVKATAFTATVTADDVTRSYEQVGSTDEYAPEEAAVTLKVTGATLTGDENASWTLSATDITTKVSTPNDVKLSSEEQLTVGAVEKEVTLTLTGTEIKYTTTVSVNVKASTTDEHDPEYVAGPVAITKNDVRKIGVIFADGVTANDFKAANASTKAKYDISDIQTGTAKGTVVVGDSVEFTLIGLADDMTNKLPYILVADDYKEVGTSTIPSTATTAANITDLVVGDADPIPALAATYQFKPAVDEDADNFAVEAKVTLSVTVKDRLDDPTSSLTFAYKGTWNEEEGTNTPTQVEPGKALTVFASEFSAYVQTEGDQWVKIVGDKIWGADKVSFTADEVKAGDTLKFNVSWKYDDEFGGPYSGVATDASISVKSE